MTPAQQKLAAAASAAIVAACKTIGPVMPEDTTEPFFEDLAVLLVEENRCTPRAAERAIDVAVLRLTGLSNKSTSARRI